MTRVIVHAGFHKTGTSSLQDQLHALRPQLGAYAAIYLKEDFQDAGNAGRIYGLKPLPWRLRRFRQHLRKFLRAIPADPVIVLSWEGFSGVMPGHRRIGGRMVRDISTAGRPLARSIVKELRKRFGPSVEICFLYTLRERETWIRSVYGHIVRSIRLTSDFDTFRQDLPQLPHLADEAARIGQAIAPVPVQTSDLKDTAAHPQGPAISILKMIGVPDAVIDNLPPAPKKNAGNSEVQRQECLRLNRTVKDAVDLKRQKDALVGFKPASAPSPHPDLSGKQ